VKKQRYCVHIRIGIHEKNKVTYGCGVGVAPEMVVEVEGSTIASIFLLVPMLLLGLLTANDLSD